MAELTYDPATGELVGGDVTPAPMTPTPPQAPAVAGDPWDRLYRAAELGLQDPELPRRLQADTLAMFSPVNLLCLAIILAAWAGASIAGGPVAWVVDLGLGALGLYTIGEQIIAFGKHFAAYALGAYAAETDAELRQAGHEFALALVEAGDLAIQTAFNAAAFKAVRVAVGKRFKVPPRAPREREPEERPPQERTPEERAAEERRQRGRTPEERAPEERTQERRTPLPDVVMGSGAGRAGRELASALPAIAGGVAVVAVVALAAWAMSRRRRRRNG